jgi:hypothetical protein
MNETTLRAPPGPSQPRPDPRWQAALPTKTKGQIPHTWWYLSLRPLPGHSSQGRLLLDLGWNGAGPWQHAIRNLCRARPWLEWRSTLATMRSTWQQCPRRGRRTGAGRGTAPRLRSSTLRQIAWEMAEGGRWQRHCASAPRLHLSTLTTIMAEGGRWQRYFASTWHHGYVARH